MANLEVTQAEYDQLLLKENKLQEQIVEVNKRIQKARELGDLSENEEYAAARRDYTMLTEDLKALTARIAQSVIVNGKTSEIITAHSHFILEHMSSHQQYDLILTTQNIGPPHNVSADSLLARNAIGKRVGDIIEYVDNLYRHQQFKVIQIIE